VRIALTPDGRTLVYALTHDKKVAFADPKGRRETGYVIVPGQPLSCTLSHDGKLVLIGGFRRLRLLFQANLPT
jgi:hypothetical protein